MLIKKESAHEDNKTNRRSNHQRGPHARTGRVGARGNSSRYEGRTVPGTNYYQGKSRERSDPSGRKGDSQGQGMLRRGREPEREGNGDPGRRRWQIPWHSP